ncbi:uncharacterized protein LOC100876293 isoform X2 [Megachile rotundata]|uniref:uncharacterized protein LOC100876293 isoform X2 n=1 Tax=Megachile rotundata TaxID=143995 RepID=UPI000258F0F9|nr:PREDICTED: uncharacterized protein LOC100876293 isoform X2 [Megachile rotundata]
MLGPLKRIKFLHHANNLLSNSSVDCLKNNFVLLRTLKLTADCKFNDDLSDDEDEKKKRKKTIPLPKITLENTDGSLSVVLLNEAAKIAKRRNMFLIKMPYVDTKGSRDIYKIVDHATYINNSNADTQVDLQNNKKEKNNRSNKSFTIFAKINEHDLETKVNNINRLLKKNHLVTIILNCAAENTNKIFSQVKTK